MHYICSIGSICLFFTFFTLLLVTRSQTTLIRGSRLRIRNCFVAIEPNFSALSLQWLQRRPPPPPPQRNNQNDQRDQRNEAGSSNIQAAQASAARAAPISTQRRTSVASCRNIFEIDGTVQELGFDYLHRVPRTNTVIGPPIVLDEQQPSTSGIGQNSAIDEAILDISTMPDDLSMQEDGNKDDFELIEFNYDSDDSEGDHCIDEKICNFANDDRESRQVDGESRESAVTANESVPFDTINGQNDETPSW